jgi:hypothetical protein
MRFWFQGDGTKFEGRIEVDRKTAIALFKAILATLGVLVPILEALARLSG